MPNPKARKEALVRDATRKRAARAATKRLAGAAVLSSADVRAMRTAGVRVEDLGAEEGQKVSFLVYSALLRDRDALKAHLGWHHESIKNPDVGTIVEQVLARGGLEDVKRWLTAHDIQHIIEETIVEEAGR